MDFAIAAVVFLVLGLAVLTGLGQTVTREERSWVVRLLVAAFLLRMLFATMFAAFPETRVFHEDADGYEYMGQLLAAQWGGHAPPTPFTTHMNQNYGFTYLCGAVYYILSARVAPSYLNCLLGTVVVFAIYRLTRRFFIVPVAKRAALLCAFFPSMVLWSAMTLKDTSVTFLIVLSLWSCIAMKDRFSVWSFLGIILPIAAIQPIRFYMIYFVGFAVVASLLFERGAKALSGMPKQIIIIGAAVGLLTFVGVMGAAEEGTSVMSFEKVSSFRQGMASTAKSGFSADVDISTPGKALAFMPIGVTMLLFSPFPWQFTSLRAALAAPEMFLWWALVPALYRGLRFAIRRRLAETSPILLFSLVLTLAYSLVHGNIGSGFRQRAQILVFLFIFTSVGVFLKRAKQAGLSEEVVLAGQRSATATPAKVPAAPNAALATRSGA